MISIPSAKILPSYQRNLLAFVLGSISVFSQAPYDISLILFLTLPCFIWLMAGDSNESPNWHKSNLWQAFKRGWWFGFGYLLASLWWVGSAFLVDQEAFIYLLPFAIVALPAGLALYYGLGAMIARLLWRNNSLAIIALALGFGVAEYLRGTLFTGFPWNSLGYGAMPSPFWMQSVALIGFYPLNFLAILVFSSPAIFLLSRPIRIREYLFLDLCIILIIAHAYCGYLYFKPDNLILDESTTIKIVQPNIAQKDKWDPKKKQQNFNKLLDVSEQGSKQSDIIIWPESTFPFYLQETPEAQKIIGESLASNTTLIAGGLRFEESNSQQGYDVYNSLFIINDEGNIIDSTDKTHLLPFGEFLPFQDFLESLGVSQLTQLPGGFTYGKTRKILKPKNAPAFLPLICYEIIFPNQLILKEAKQSLNRQSPKWIINVTNDGWFGDTPGPHQHLRQTQIRAVEERMSIFRAANSGISAIITPLGEISQSLPLNQSGTLSGRIYYFTKQ